MNLNNMDAFYNYFANRRPVSMVFLMISICFWEVFACTWSAWRG